VFVYILYGLAGFYFLTILCLFRGIQVSIAVLETAAVVILRNIRILIVPFISSIVIFSFIGVWIVGAIYMVSSANITLPPRSADDNLSQLKDINLDGKEYLKWHISVYVFGLFWIAELLAAIFHYALIVGVCTWYFTSTADSRGSFSLFKGFWWALRYNLGSLALGSFILALIWVIRIVFEYFQSKLQKMGGDNSVTKCATCVIRCCLDCCHRFVKFLNKNAYIQVALTGKNFCSSAMAAFVLALKNSGSFIITNGIGALIQLLGKLSITVGNVIVAYIMLTQLEGVRAGAASPYPPLLIVAGISYLMANIFMSVYSITSLTLLQCLYADVDLCKQSDSDIWESKQRPVEMRSIVNKLRKD
jgi:choline transporter-like protein 2/4/5